MEDDMQNVDNIMANIARLVNSLSEENRLARRRGIEGIKKELLPKNGQLDPEVLQGVLNEVIKPLLKLVSDPIEKCRELTITTLSECLRCVPRPQEYLPYIIPVLVQRLGQQDVTEPSEELRLLLIEMLSAIVDLTGKNLAVYLDDLVKILQRTIVDQFPEVKKQSCKCASAVAKSMPEHFHMQSESLIKPLLLTISHQHSKVRVDAVCAIGNVIQYGNGKSVDDVVSHLAQRLFDHSPVVRSAVVDVVGGWLLDLMDRYSYHHKLIPLLLTCLQDEMPDIREKADALWHDVGLKYEEENEDDLKDKQNFTTPELQHYPPRVERPNLGCRELMLRNFSKILSGLVRDLTDWVAPTRIKSSQLLYVMLLNEENNVTQHMEKVLSGLYKAAGDEEQEVVNYVSKSAELLGYFVSPEIWTHLVLPTVQTSQSPGTLLVLAAIVRGSEHSQLKAYLHELTSTLCDPQLCRIAAGELQNQLLACAAALMDVLQDECASISSSLFNLLVTVLSLHRNDMIKEQADQLLSRCASLQGYPDKQHLYKQHTRDMLLSLKEDYVMWTQHSVERLIFDTLLIESGPVVGEVLEEVVPMLVANLKPEKDPELRLKFFSLLSRLIMRTPETLDSADRFGDVAVTVVRDMILPNLVWHAGRTAAAIRTTAMSSLWALLHSNTLKNQQMEEVKEELLTQLRSSLDDDNKQTRLIACRAMTHLFRQVGTKLDRDHLHNMYPDLLKRLDDGSDDIRLAIAKTFVAYFDCFEEQFEASLYRAHLEAIYQGLLVHLDDAEPRIQEAVLEVLMKSAGLLPQVLMCEIDKVRFKHRNSQHLTQLEEHIKTLPHDELPQQQAE